MWTQTSEAATVLSDRILARLRARSGDEQITFIRRNGAPLAFTGETLEREAKMLAQQLRAWLGPEPKSLVVALPAGAEFLLTLLAGVLAQITIIPVTVPRKGSHSEQFGHAVRDSGADAVVCAATSQDDIRARLACLARGGPVCPVVSLPLDRARLPPVLPRAREGGRGSDNSPPPAIIQYTSGSTRAPKGVRIMPWQIVENCQLVTRIWQMDVDTRVVNWLPHYHDMGLMGGIFYPLLCGGVSFQMNPLDFIQRPESWLRAISDNRANFSGGPAFAFADCCRRITVERVAELDLSSWRRAFCGAEPIPAGLLDTFHAHFAPAGLKRASVFGCYGMAEVTLFAGGAPGGADAVPGAPVQPCHLTEELRDALRIVDPETRHVLPAGQTGEIWLRGPSLADGYHNLPEETARTFRQSLAGEGPCEWLRTGDLGFVSGAELCVTGRIKDILLCNGSKVSASEVEWLACADAADLNPLAAAAFMPDQTANGQAVLIIETRLGHGISKDADSLRRAIRQKILGEWGIDLTDILFVPRGRLDRTSSGKIRRQAVAQAYRDGAFAAQGKAEAS